MKNRQRKKTARILSLVLALVTMLTTVLAITGCGKDEEPNVGAPLSTLESTENTVNKNTEPETTESTVTETIPTAEDLIAALKHPTGSIYTNYTLHATTKYSMQNEEESDSYSVDLVAESFKDIVYNCNTIEAECDGDKFSFIEEYYSCYDSDEDVYWRYSDYDKENEWTIMLDNEPCVVIEDAFITADYIESHNMSTTEVNSTTDYYELIFTMNEEITDEILDDLFFDAGVVEDTTPTVTYTARFNKDTLDLVYYEMRCKFILPEDMSTDYTIEDTVLEIKLNDKEVVIPQEIIDTAVEPDWSDIPGYREDPIHEGWSSYYNNYSDNIGTFGMLDDSFDWITVAVAEKENWYYDNTTIPLDCFVAVRDDSVIVDGPTYIASYAESYITVDFENTTEALDYLLTVSATEQGKTIDDVTKFTVNDKSGYYINYEDTSAKTIRVLYDIGLQSFVSIDIKSWNDIIDTAALVEEFVSNIHISEEH